MCVFRSHTSMLTEHVTQYTLGFFGAQFSRAIQACSALTRMNSAFIVSCFSPAEEKVMTKLSTKSGAHFSRASTPSFLLGDALLSSRSGCNVVRLGERWANEGCHGDGKTCPQPCLFDGSQPSWRRLYALDMTLLIL